MPVYETDEGICVAGPSKIATCCYCGSRAALVLTGKDRHELTCSTCGAPLHDMKRLRSKKAGAGAEWRAQGASAVSHLKPPKKPKSKAKKKPRKSLWRSVLEEAVDVVEDIFD